MTDAPLLHAHGLHKRFRQGTQEVHALRGVDLQIHEGEFAVLAGPSGSGKSTLLNLLGLLDTPSEGRLQVGGRDAAGLSSAGLARLRRDELGFVFQAYNLMPVLSALENTELVLEFQGVPQAERRRRSTELLTELGLAEHMHRFPDQLSGGQQQRVAVARAIVSRPRIVLADEPTANLDSVTATSLMDLLVSLNRDKGISFVFSSHDPNVIDRARRVLRLRDGQLVADERRDRVAPSTVPQRPLAGPKALAA